MKKPFLIVMLLLLTVSMSAQRQFRKPLKSTKPGTNLAFSNYTVGLKLGCPWSILLNSELSEVNYLGNFGYTAGFVAERYFQRFSIGIEGLFSQKGTKMSYDMNYQVSLTTTDVFHREFFMGYNVASVRIPLTYYFKGTFKDDKVVPYVFIAPQVDIPLGFNATLGEKNGKIGFVFEKPLIQHTLTSYGTITDSQEKPVDKKALLSVNALAGMGIIGRIPTEGSAIILKFDIAANYGLRNLAEEGFIWKQVTDQNGKKSLVLKDNDKTIRSHDVEANLTIIIPIKKRLHDACWNFKSNMY